MFQRHTNRCVHVLAVSHKKQSSVFLTSWWKLKTAQYVRPHPSADTLRVLFAHQRYRKNSQVRTDATQPFASSLATSSAESRSSATSVSLTFANCCLHQCGQGRTYLARRVKLSAIWSCSAFVTRTTLVRVQITLLPCTSSRGHDLPCTTVTSLQWSNSNNVSAIVLSMVVSWMSRKNANCDWDVHKAKRQRGRVSESRLDQT